MWRFSTETIVSTNSSSSCFNSDSSALQEMVSKMQTPAITLCFPEQCLLGFFIIEKQLASQDMFLIRSELSITAYLFLVLYRSTSLQSVLFLKNIKTFLCKQKLVNNCSIPSMHQPYNNDSVAKILKPSTALQSPAFLKNIENFLCKQKLVNDRTIPPMHTERKITRLSD